MGRSDQPSDQGAQPGGVVVPAPWCLYDLVFPTAGCSTYLLKSGCQWRMLPADFSNWSSHLLDQYLGRQWSERPGLGAAIDPVYQQQGLWSKSDWARKIMQLAAGPTKQWTERADQLLHRGLPEREEHATPPGTRAMTPGQEGVRNQASHRRWTRQAIAPWAYM